MGLYFTGVCTSGCCRRNPLYPNSILFIYRRSTGSENSAASLHGGHQQRSPSSDPTVWQYYFQKSDPIRWCGTGVFPGRCGKIYEEKRPDLYRKNPVRCDAAKRPGTGRSLLWNHPSENRRLHERCQRRAVETGCILKDSA